MTTTKAQKAEQEAAIEQLREMLRPGDTVRTILRHCSRSGMSRSISPIINGEDYSWLVARAIGGKTDNVHGGVKVGGCGMDMGFDLVYRLSYRLYGGQHGYDCLGEGLPPRYEYHCPSNYHSNHSGEGRWTEAHHTDGYAISQRWL